jgi:uncharacterized membrane protein required for colicin V production
MFLNPLDGLIILGLGVGAFWGFNRGTFRGAIELACLYLATLVTTLLFQKPARWLASRFSLPLPFVEITVFTLLLLAAFFAFFYIAMDFLRPPQARYLGFADRLGGMVFGFLFALVIISLLLIFLDYALGVNWLRWEHLRKAILETRDSSFVAPLVKEFGRSILAVLKPFFPKGLPALIPTEAALFQPLASLHLM